MFLLEVIKFATALIELATPVIDVICHWIKLELSKRYGVS